MGRRGSAETLDAELLIGVCAEGAVRAASAGDVVLEVMLMITGAMLQALAGRVGEADAAAREALQQASAIGAPREVARAQLCLGIGAYLRGDLAITAGHRLQEARTAWEAEGEAQQVPWFLVVTGQLLVAADGGDRVMARRCLAGLLGLWSRLERLPQLAGCLQALAYLSAAEGNWRQVLRIGAVLERQGGCWSWCATSGGGSWTSWRKPGAALSADAAAEAWAEGSGMSLHVACELAEVVAHQRPSRQRLAGGLSAREAEVLRLVADGKTNRQISEELVLSERTVAKHLDHVYTKLGVSSRAAAVAFAVRSGL